MLTRILAVSCVWVLSCAVVQAQENPEKAVLAFDIRLDKMREGETYQKAELEAMVGEATWGLGDEIDFEKVKRIFGAANAPESLAILESMGPGDPLPLDFFVQFQFVNATEAKRVFDDVKSKSKVEKKNGKTIIRPEGRRQPINILAHLYNETTLEFGTDGYVFLDTRKYFSDNLSAAWAKNPNHAARAAMDFDGARGFLEEAIANGKEFAPPPVRMFMDLVGKTSALRLAIDLDHKTLVALGADGTDAENATSLKGGLDAVLGMAKFAAKGPLEQVNATSPEMGKVASTLLESLQTEIKGLEVTLNLPRPEGFTDAIVASLKQARVAATATQRMNNAKQLALSVHNFHATYRHFPLTPLRGQSDDLSWRIRILPFFDVDEVAVQMDMKQGWDSETNKQFAGKMPALFGSDGRNSRYVWIIPKRVPRAFADITDGTSNTIMLLELPRGKGKPWSKPGDVTVDEALEFLTNIADGESVIAAFYDGSVQRIDNSYDKDKLKSLLEPTDGK